MCVCSGGGGCLLPGGVSALGGVCSRGCVCVCSRQCVCVCSWEVSALGGVCSGGGVCSSGGVCSVGGVCSEGSLLWGVSAPGGVVSQHALRRTPPPVKRMTDRCKNITLATTSLRPVKITMIYYHSKKRIIRGIVFCHLIPMIDDSSLYPIRPHCDM